MTIVRSWKGMVMIATSLDGYIARKDGDIEWLTNPPRNTGHAPDNPGPNAPPGYDPFMREVDHLVMGRGTYEKVLTFGDWPYKTVEVVVLSTTLQERREPGITFSNSLQGVARILDERHARAVYVDGGKIIQTFLQAGLIDEMTVSVAPVLIGDGLTLFGHVDKDVRLTHLGTSSGGGMTTTRYAVTAVA